MVGSGDISANSLYGFPCRHAFQKTLRLEICAERDDHPEHHFRHGDVHHRHPPVRSADGDRERPDPSVRSVFQRKRPFTGRICVLEYRGLLLFLGRHDHSSFDGADLRYPVGNI